MTTRTTSCQRPPLWSALAAGALLLAASPTRAQPFDEPGIRVEPDQDASAASRPTDPLTYARAHCGPDQRCPVFGDLVRLLGTAEAGAQAATLLGQLGDPRGVHPLAQSAVYGPNAPVRQAARGALGSLVRLRGPRSASHKLARFDPDPAVREALAAALGQPVEDPPESDAAVQRAPAQVPAKEPARTTDPDATRVIYGPTAMSRSAGTWNWTIFNVAYWRFDYGITDHLEVGMETVPPVAVLGFKPYVKLSFPLGSAATLGVQATGGVFYPYVENDADHRFAIYGGGPILTLGDPDLLLNVGFAAYGLTHASKGEPVYMAGPYPDASYDPGTDYDTTWLLLPNLGFGWRFSQRAKLNLELMTPISEMGEQGKIWVLFYGVRFFGERIYGDVSFVIPFFEGMSEYIKYIPIGYPFLAFGFQW